ncbi:MAG: hypothetical protein ACKPJJ_06805, partial [Planctomycetaceae bacterium]
KLQSVGLPVMSVPADVARALGISLQSLRGLAFHAEVAGLTNYLRFTVPKRGGGERELSVPHRRLAAGQARRGKAACAAGACAVPGAGSQAT